MKWKKNELLTNYVIEIYRGNLNTELICLGLLNKSLNYCGFISCGAHFSNTEEGEVFLVHRNWGPFCTVHRK